MNTKTDILVSLVIPCYNESNRLHILKQGIEEFWAQWSATAEIIVVDDGSKDDTSVQIQQQLSNVHFIQLPENQGKGGALRAGVLVAKGKYILTVDADMATHPLELKRWLQQFPSQQFPNEILIGSRKHPKSEIDVKQHRKWAGQLFNLWVKILTPIRFSDTQCGFKLYPAAIAKLLFQDLQIRGWAHDIELLYKAAYLKIPVRAMPIRWQHVDDEKIDVLSDGIKMAKEITLMSYRYHLQPQGKRHLKLLQQEFVERSKV
ncbi:MAG: glycosyltransferase [Bacteroidota bacterium]